jgi:pyruvate/2-oxoglutarate dehydrogenase complex dihydrolipoamide dehydrogenase (E3) component
MHKQIDASYNLIVIGAGSGGLVAAETAAKLGARVALIESQNSLGGECLHSGCVPSKALIHAARIAWEAGHSRSLGVTASPVIDFAVVQQHMRRAIKTIEDNHDNDGFYKQLGVNVIHGTAAFSGRNTIMVGGKTLSAKRFIIATGSRPAVPDSPGLADGPYLTNESVFSLDSLPESLLVIGGGPIGCELGQAFAMLGTRVTIIQSGDRLLPRDEVAAAALLQTSLENMGVDIKLGATIKSTAYDDSSVSLTLTDGTVIRAQKLLVAAGRQANIPDNLELAGIASTRRGITVDKTLRTTNKHIYAVGDCNGGPQFTHAAGEQAGIAVQNALFGTRKSFEATTIPWTTFTTPEIAHFGPLISQLDDKKAVYQAHRLSYGDIDKAIAEGETGYIEVLADTKQRILAATVVGVTAAEILARIVTTPTLKQLSSGIQAYPTYALGVRQLALQTTLDKLLQSLPGKLAQGWIRTKFK